MGADIYLQSVYDKQREEYKVDELRAQLDAFRHLDDNSDEAKRQIETTREQFLIAMRAAEKGAYFRDSYNSSNLAWLCGLSYWNENPNLDENGCLRIDRAREWLAMLESVHIPQVVLHAKLNYEENRRREKLAADNNYKDLEYADLAKPELHIDAGEQFKDVVIYFADKRQTLMALLQRSIDLDEPLIWSV